MIPVKSEDESDTLQRVFVRRFFLTSFTASQSRFLLGILVSDLQTSLFHSFLKG